MKRYIFTYNSAKAGFSGLTDKSLQFFLASTISSLLGLNHKPTVRRLTNIKETTAIGKYSLDAAKTWFLIIYTSHTFEIKRDEAHGEEGLPELANWAAFVLKDVATKTDI